mmetsp:Transcript_17692/g.48110  ORF Transcript_17692/g.48110 Transcript_17692/m.48110 type:complete len:251 (+) Transcript_17692:441-1193(+)
MDLYQERVETYHEAQAASDCKPRPLPDQQTRAACPSGGGVCNKLEEVSRKHGGRRKVQQPHGTIRAQFGQRRPRDMLNRSPPRPVLTSPQRFEHQEKSVDHKNCQDEELNSADGGTPVHREFRCTEPPHNRVDEPLAEEDCVLRDVKVACDYPHVTGDDHVEVGDYEQHHQDGGSRPRRVPQLVHLREAAVPRDHDLAEEVPVLCPLELVPRVPLELQLHAPVGPRARPPAAAAPRRLLGLGPAAALRRL